MATLRLPSARRDHSQLFTSPPYLPRIRPRGGWAWICLLAALPTLTVCCGPTDESHLTAAPHVVRAGRAMTDGDDHAWKLFFSLNRQALPNRAGCPDPRFSSLRCYEDDRDVVWETWARASADKDYASEVFPPEGSPRPWNELVRPQPRKPLSDLTDSLCNFLRPQSEMVKVMHFQATGQEVRLNEPAFSYVLNEQLYSKKALSELFDRASKTGNADIISFPSGSMTVKAIWRSLPILKDRLRYHWRVQDGKTYGLVALHIVSKDVPLWFWTTFIHDDVPIQNDRISRDNRRPEISGTKWAQYKLVGTQVSFSDARGVPTILGNSAIEGTPETSCITCHAFARIDAHGNSVSGPLNPMGTPRSCEFWDTSVIPWKLRYLTPDFVWVVATSDKKESVRDDPGRLPENSISSRSD